MRSIKFERVVLFITLLFHAQLKRVNAEERYIDDNEGYEPINKVTQDPEMYWDGYEDMYYDKPLSFENQPSTSNNEDSVENVNTVNETIHNKTLHRTEQNVINDTKLIDLILGPDMNSSELFNYVNEYDEYSSEEMITEKNLRDDEILKEELLTENSDLFVRKNIVSESPPNFIIIVVIMSICITIIAVIGTTVIKYFKRMPSQEFDIWWREFAKRAYVPLDTQINVKN